MCVKSYAYCDKENEGYHNLEMTNEIINPPLGFARGTILKAPSGRHHSNSPSASLDEQVESRLTDLQML